MAETNIGKVSDATSKIINKPSFRETIEERVRKNEKRNVECIVYEIYEKEADGKWKRTEVLVEKRNHDMLRQHYKSHEKADQYRGYGNIFCLSSETFATLGKAFCGQTATGLAFDAISSGLGNSRRLLVDERRIIVINLVDNQIQRLNTFINDGTSSIQNSEGAVHKARDRQSQTIQSAKDVARSILS